MGRRLRMTAELGDWLTELGGSEPVTAAEVAAALVAVLESADLSGLAIVGDLTAVYSHDPRETADLLYQQMLEQLQHVRRSVADVASSRKRTDLRLAAERAAGADAAGLAKLESELAAVQQSEEQLAEQSQWLQWQVDAFRAAKETAKAMYTAAEAHLRIADAMAVAEGRSSDADPAQHTAALQAARESLDRVTGEGMALLDRVREQAGPLDDERRDWPPGEHPEPPPPQPQTRPVADEPARGLLELRADTTGTDIRILFAVEPADTVTLLAVLEGPDAVSEHGPDAVRLASDLLTEVRADGWPVDVDEVSLADSGAFLASFFPADDGGISRRAALLAAS